MLAHSWAKEKNPPPFPLYAQPKLDGCRALMQDGLMWSRGGKPFHPVIVGHLCFDTAAVILDGELMLPHLDYTFQDTMRAIKKFRPVSPLLEYHVYDCILPDWPEAPFNERRLALFGILAATPALVLPVTTASVGNDADVAEWHAYFTHPDQGYEGAILRDPGSLYTPGHRSHGLLKHKDMQDAEFEIVGVGEGVGKFVGVIMFTCVTLGGATFECGLKDSLDNRRAMYERRAEYLGQWLTVRYQNLTDDGLPRFPVGISIRDGALQG